MPCSENIPYTTGTSSGGKDLSTTRVCRLHKLQAVLPALPQPARSAPCPQACPSVPAPCCGASAGPRSCCWGQSQLTHSSPGSPGGGTATLPRQSCHLLSRDLPRSLHRGIFPFFFFLMFSLQEIQKFLPTNLPVTCISLHDRSDNFPYPGCLLIPGTRWEPGQLRLTQKAQLRFASQILGGSWLKIRTWLFTNKPKEEPATF